MFSLKNVLTAFFQTIKLWEVTTFFIVVCLIWKLVTL